MKTTLTLGTRGSPLALLQTQKVTDSLASLGFETRVVTVKTLADRFLDKPLTDIGGKALFSRELDQHLLSGSCDICVHSLKDLESNLHPDLHIIATLPRDNPLDTFIIKNYPLKNTPSHPLPWPFLPRGATVGTCAPRRKAFLLHHRPDLNVLPLRGNIQRRLHTLEKKPFDAIVLAQAALDRLSLSLSHTHTLHPDTMLPACAQGVIAVVAPTHAFPSHYHNPLSSSPLAPLNHTPTALTSRAERACLSFLGCSCQSPIAALATLTNNTLSLSATVLSHDGHHIYQASHHAPLSEKPELLGEKIGHELALALPHHLLQTLGLQPRSSS